MPKERSRILVIGSLNVDLIASGTRIPYPGETTRGRNFKKCLGGKGANQAVAAARAGADVWMAGAVGDDDMGRAALEHLAECGIDNSLCTIVPDTHTGVAVIMIDGNAENCIMIIPGANGSLLPPVLESIEWDKYDAVLLQLEIPTATVWSAIRKASGIAKIILTPAPADEIPPDLLPLIDILIPNQHEVVQLGDGRDPLAAAAGLSKRVRGGVALTLGSDGVKWFAGGAEPLHVPAPRVAAIDTVGAGDCFTGYFATAWLSGEPAEVALSLACRAAALQTTRPGGLDAMPFASEL